MPREQSQGRQAQLQMEQMFIPFQQFGNMFFENFEQMTDYQIDLARSYTHFAMSQWRDALEIHDQESLRRYFEKQNQNTEELTRKVIEDTEKVMQASEQITRRSLRMVQSGTETATSNMQRGVEQAQSMAQRGVEQAQSIAQRGVEQAQSMAQRGREEQRQRGAQQESQQRGRQQEGQQREQQTQGGLPIKRREKQDGTVDVLVHTWGEGDLELEDAIRHDCGKLLNYYSTLPTLVLKLPAVDNLSNSQQIELIESLQEQVHEWATEWHSKLLFELLGVEILRLRQQYGYGPIPGQQF